MDYALINTVSESVYKVIKYGLISGLALSFLVLLVGSFLVHDTYYITKNPKFFISETLIMGILTGLPVLYISYLRGGTKKESLQHFTLLFLKIAVIHIGFQLSGVYSVLFPESSNMH